ncbi:MAG: aminoacyltransferase [Erysipelotrichaceae bacterium]|nr:aminoacyltransferase [Erysipelotrichaceae bacterium]
MTFTDQITALELDNYVYSKEFSHYMHTSTFAKYKHIEEGCTVHYTALKDQDRIMATAIVLEYHEPLAGSYVYIPCGICMDHLDTALFKEYSDHLIAYAKKLNAFAVYMDPNVMRNEHLLNGDIIEDGVNNEHLTAFYQSLGYTHRGYTYGYDGSKRNRYTLMLDIDRPYSEVLKGMPKSRQSYLRKASKMAIRVNNTREEIAGKLAIYAEELSKTQNFTPHTKEYFARLFDIYGEHCYGYECEIDLKRQLEIYQEDVEDKKYRKDPEAKAAVEKNIVKMQEYIEMFGDRATLGVAFYVVCNDTSYNLFNYNNKSLLSFQGTDIIHDHVIQHMQSLGVKHYDLVGFSGLVDEKDSFYGLYKYKSSFSPTYIEHLGEFCYVLSESRFKMYKAYREGKRLARRVVQKLGVK